MKRRAIVLLLALLLLSCEPIVQRVVTLTFNDTADQVRISATTKLGKAKPDTPEYAQIRDEREALLAGRDEWSVRFANADPQSDRIVMERERGELQELEHSATIASENLQKFFFDTHLTVTFTRGEGWAELTIYPGTSERATRQQRQRVETVLAAYSESAARYFEAIRSMYFYLDEKPQRAAALFETIFAEKEETRPILSREESSLMEAVKESLDKLTSSQDAGAGALDREFDLVFNPFPAELRVKIPGEIAINENFTKLDNDVVAVKVPDALKAVSMLEGRWITPDPLAVAFAASENQKSKELAASMADMPRRAAVVVTPSDIAAALMEKMRPAPRYRLRWLTKPTAAPSPPRPHHRDSSGGGDRAPQSRDARKSPALRDWIAALRGKSW